MQVLVIAGNVGKDAVLRRTQDGEPVLGFSVAVDNGKDKDGNNRAATWVEASVWGKRAQSLEQHIVKGTKLALTGRPTVREHDGKAYLGIVLNELTFMGSPSNDREEPRRQERETPSQKVARTSSQRPYNDLDDEEIPF